MIDLRNYKKEIVKEFRRHKIDVDEVNILFCEALNCSRIELLNKATLKLREQIKIELAVKRRLNGEPIQKIFKRAYFYGLTLYINNNVLCPRPETELLVEETLKYVKDKSKVLDLCTGSGAIAIAIGNNSKAKIVASDNSSRALEVAKRNADSLNLDIEFVRSNMFQKIYNKYNIIVSNPPYIPSGDCDKLDKEVKDYDPRKSLDGGKDGLDFYRQIAIYAPYFLESKGRVLLEVGINQSNDVVKLLEQSGFDCYIRKDYNDIDRIVVGELR